MKKIFLLWIVFFLPNLAFAEIQKKKIEYNQGETILEGYLVYDDGIKDPRPGVLVVHDWMGFGEYGNKRAEMLAELGYVALAVDIYGKGVRPKNTDEASQQATLYKSNRSLMRERIIAGLDELKKQVEVDPAKTAAIGYCFGGTVVLELARSGADVTGVVSFHGGLNTPTPQDAKNAKSKVLVLHGAVDPYVPVDEVNVFKKEMEDAKVDYKFVAYEGAVHSFTRLDAGDDPSKGVAYNAEADQKSWEEMKNFFMNIFK